MRNFINIISEMPVHDVSVHGDDLDTEGSFNAKDRAYMKRSILDKAYQIKLKNIPIDLYVYILNNDDLEYYGKLYPEARIDLEKDHTIAVGPKKILFSDIKGYPELKKLIQARLGQEPNSVHFVMGDNFSEDNQISPTPWILVHRFIHSCALIDMFSTEIFAEKIGIPVEEMIDQFMNNWLMMKSAVNKKITDENEMIAEMVTEYLMLGKLRINTKHVTEYCTSRKIDYNSFMQNLNSGLTYFYKSIDSRFKTIEGKAFYV